MTMCTENRGVYNALMTRTVDWTRKHDHYGGPLTRGAPHEAIHHGQWSVYASLGGFDTPPSWRASRGW